MKHKLILAAGLFLSFFAFSQNQSSIIGTWKLVSGKMTRNDSTFNYGSSNLNSMKIITPTHFAVFGQNADGSFSHASAGVATFTGNTYTESIDYGSFQNAMGSKMTFTYSIKGNQLHISGGGSGYTFDEDWERVK